MRPVDEPQGAPLTSDVFAGRIGETFAATAADGTPVELTLTRCDVTPYGDPDAWRGTVGRVPFSLEFVAQTEHDAAQGMVAFADATLGDVFMTPVGRGADGVRYEAVFS